MDWSGYCGRVRTELMFGNLMSSLREQLLALASASEQQAWLQVCPILSYRFQTLCKLFLNLSFPPLTLYTSVPFHPP
ncbi:hypothetical protein QL285_021562 [Trifolium repens]|nr:hypothetical protein QL285_021562 [Trifolium repens]